MADTRRYTYEMRELEGNSSALTDGTTEYQLKSIGVTVLEMEDVLFHLDSAVMMPTAPAGKSSKQGEKDDGPDDLGSSFHKEQEAVSGIQALALVFKQFELNPDKQMLVAGHTDTSGEPKYNFKLSEDRAFNVLYLLTVDKPGWTTNCARRHHIEDFQQIMKYYAARKGWDCDPGKVDNAWGKNTDTATENFLRKAVTEPPESLFLDDTLAYIRKQKKWPAEAWEPVFDLYMEDLAGFLQVKPTELKGLADLYLRFVDDDKKFVACGESFPIDDREKKNYRSQTNRRVEILLFDEDEAPILDCPLMVNGEYPNKVHTSEECPLWDKINFLPLYIDPKDLYAVVYHFRFVYFDRVAQKLTDVPAGLHIQAYTTNADVIPTVTAFKKGLYYVKTQFDKPVKDLEFMNLRFRFETKDQWIFTESASAQPKLVTMGQSAFDALPAKDKAKYYRLPEKWNSNGFYARYQGPAGGVSNDDIMEGRDKRELFKFLFTRYFPERSPKYKPFGDSVTAPDKPLVFCLDDAVLTTKDLVPTSVGKVQGAYLDSQLKVLDPDTGAHKSYYSQGMIDPGEIPFSKKMVPVRAIIYVTALYALYDERVTSADGMGSHDGLRAFSTGRLPHCVLAEKFTQDQPVHDLGNSDLYLLKDWDLANDEEISFIMVYIRWEFQGVVDPNKPTDPPFNPTPEWMDESVKGITGFWNNRSKTGDDTLASLTTKDANGKKKRVYIRYYLEPVTALRHTLVKVFPVGAEGRSNMGRVDGELRAGDNKPDEKSHSFTAAHEFGHATSLDDEYVEEWKDASYRQPGFRSYTPGSPYGLDANAMMVENKEARARYYWHLAEWLATVDGGNYAVEHEKYRYQLALYPQAAGFNLRTHISFPLLEKKNVNGGNARALYDTVLRVLGEDQFGKGDKPGALIPGHAPDGLLQVLVNMKIEFEAGTNFWDISNAIIFCQRRINKALNFRDGDHRGKWYFKGAFNGTVSKTFSKCALLFYPRFLVPNFPGPKDDMVEYYAKDVEIYKKNAAGKFDYAQTSQAYNGVVTKWDAKKHFEVKVRSAGVFEKHSAKWDSLRKLTITTGWFTDASELLVDEFPRMIGVDKKATDVQGADLMHLVTGQLANPGVDTFK